jgi:hypothetical protein
MHARAVAVVSLPAILRELLAKQLEVFSRDCVTPYTKSEE